MGNNLQFMDCSNCGKRVRTTATKCHHCQQLLVSTVGPPPTLRSQPARAGQDDNADAADQSHVAVNGGYDTDQDDFDYEEYLADEFPDHTRAQRPHVKPWVWITAWILIFATLLPFIYYFLMQ